MNIPGHLAVGYLSAVWAQRRGGELGRSAPRLGRDLAPALLGALTPDLIDKPLMLVGIYRHGRTVGHSLVLLLIGVAVWRLLRTRSQGVVREKALAAHLAGMWALGIAGHFAADLINDAVGGALTGGIMLSSWLGWPFVTPSTWDYRPPFALWEGWRGVTPLEWIVVSLAVAAAFRPYWTTRSKE